MSLQLNPGPFSALLSSPVFVMNDHDEAYKLWREAGIKHHTLLHFDAHIDFEWIAEKNPGQVLEQNPLSQALMEFKNSRGWSFGNPVNNFMHLGNYLYRALQEDMVKTWYWIVPDSIWENPRGRKQIWRDLLDYYKYRTGPMSFPEKGNDSFRCSFLDIPFRVMPLKNLPRFEEPVLLNIDVDFLTTSFLKRIPSPKEMRVQLPWIWPDDFAGKVKPLSRSAVMTTLSNSVQGGFTPLQFKFFGESLKNMFSGEETCPEYSILKEVFLLRASGEDHAALEKLDGFSSEGVFEATRHYLRSQILYERKEKEAAKDALNAAVFADSEFSSVYNSQVRFYESLHRFKEANEESRMIQELLPGQLEARISQADHLLSARKNPAALEKYRHILEDHPECSSVCSRLGSFYFRKKDWSLAEFYFSKAVELNPRDLTARIKLAEVLFFQSRFQEAKNCLRETLACGGHFPAVYFLLSRTYWKLGLRQKSLDLWRKAVLLKLKVWTLRLKIK